MATTQPLLRFEMIRSFHQFRNLPPPAHPLISLIDVGTVRQVPSYEPVNMVFDFYSVALKKGFDAKITYGQQTYDFDEGLMTFTAPGQVFSVELTEDKIQNQTGWLLLIHPDFLWHTPLARKIKQYDFFDYSVYEALWLSANEEAIMSGIIGIIQQEYRSSIDKFSQDIIVAQLEALLTYCERFYQRQFITRKPVNHQLLNRLEDLLSAHFDTDEHLLNGLPTVSTIADQLNLSPGYLSGLLKSLTGLNAQQHIHAKLIGKAKEKLSTTDLSVGEIAYGLGFEHIQSFSKLFKSKTKLSPGAFRQTFN